MPPKAWLSVLPLCLLLLAGTAAPSSLYGDDRGVTAAARAAAAAAAAAGSAGSAPGALKVNCPSLITQTTDAGQPYATLALEPVVATPVTGSSWNVEPHAWSRPVTGGQFALGQTDVGYLAIADGGTSEETTATCTTTVEVLDREAPVLQCPSHLNGFKLSLSRLADLAGNITAADNSRENMLVTCGTSPQIEGQLLCTAQDSSHNIGTCTINVVNTRLEALVLSMLSALGAEDVNLTLASMSLVAAVLCAVLLHLTFANQRLMSDNSDVPGTPVFVSRTPGSAPGSAPESPVEEGSSPYLIRNVDALWEKFRPAHTPLQLPPKLTPNTADVMRSSGNRNRLETEVRWLAEQLAAATTRREEDAAYMQKLLDSERQQLQAARTELIEMKAAAEDKLARMQEKLTLKEEEFQGRDEARAEQLEAAMDAHNVERSRLMSAAAKARESAESVLVAHEADKVQIFELKSSLAKMQGREADLKAQAKESALRIAKAEERVLQLSSVVEEQKDAFFTEAKDMEAKHAATTGVLQQRIDDAVSLAEQERKMNDQQAELIASLRDRVQAAEEQADTANQELLKSQVETREVRSTASVLKQELEKATADAVSERVGAGDSEEQAIKLRASLLAATERIEELTLQLQAREASLQESKSQVAELESKKDIMTANIGTLEAQLSTAVRHEEQIHSANDDKVAGLQTEINELQSSLLAATQASAQAQESERQAKDLWRESEKQVHAQLEMLEAINRDVAQLRREKVAAETLAADEKVTASALHQELQALATTKESSVSTIATQTSPLKARKSTSNVLSEKLATLQKQAEQMREDTIHMIGQGPTPRSATSGGQAVVIPRLVPDKLCIVTPGSGKQAPAKKARIYRPSPARVTSVPMESPSPPRVGEHQAQELVVQPNKSGPGENTDFFARNPGIKDAVDSPLVSAKRRSAVPSRCSSSPTTPSEASEALRNLRAQEQNRATRPPPVPAAALSGTKSPSAVPIPNTPAKPSESIASKHTATSSRWGPPHEAAHEEVVWPAERRMTTNTTGQPSLSEELTWLHSPGA
eukprot:COSAG02_NODE_476_length_21528_cov_95.026459_1_plen_1052_part_00